MKKNNLITEEISRIKEIMGLSLITEQPKPLISGTASFTDGLAQRITQDISAYIPEIIGMSTSKQLAGLSKNTALNLLKDVAKANGQTPEVYRNKKSIASRQPLIKGNNVNIKNLDSAKLIDGFNNLNEDKKIEIIKKYIDSMVQTGVIPPEIVASEMKSVNDLDYQWALWWASNGNKLPTRKGNLLRPENPSQYLTMDFGQFMDLQGVPKSVQSALYNELAPALVNEPNLNPKYGGENEPLIQKSSKATVKPKFNSEEVSEALFQNLGNFTNFEINPKRIYNGIMTGNEPELEEVRIWLQDPKNRDKFVTNLQSKTDIAKQQEEFFNYLQREGVYEPEKTNIFRRAANKCRAKNTLPQGTKFGLFGGIKELGTGNPMEFTTQIAFCRWIQSYMTYYLVLAAIGNPWSLDLIRTMLRINTIAQISNDWADNFVGCTTPEDQQSFLNKDPHFLSLMKNFVTGDSNKEKTIDLIKNNKLYYQGNFDKFSCQQSQLFVLIPATELDGETINHDIPPQKYVLSRDVVSGNFFLDKVDDATAKDAIWSSVDQKIKDLKEKSKELKNKASELNGKPIAEPDNSSSSDTLSY